MTDSERESGETEVADRDLAVTVDRLAAADVITIDQDDDVALTPRFSTAIGEYRSEFEDRDTAELTDKLSSVVDEEGVRQLADIGVDDPGFAAAYRALVDFVEELSREQRLQTVVSLERIRGPFPRAEGAPDAFLPIRGDQIETLLKLYPKAILYAWKEDCLPCDLVADDLDEIFEEPPDDIALFAVYGPNWARELHDVFEVPGAPTTLFIKHNEVDVRLYGAHHTRVYETETKNLRHGPSPVSVEMPEPPETPGSDSKN